jgi:hypothetical protein
MSGGPTSPTNLVPNIDHPEPSSSDISNASNGSSGYPKSTETDSSSDDNQCVPVVDVSDGRVGQSGCQIVDLILSIYREVSIVVKSGQQFLFSIINVRYTLVII